LTYGVAVGGLVDVHDVPGVGEVRVEHVLHLAAGELGVERLGVLAGERVVRDDVDVRVLLLEGGGLLLEELAVDLGALGRHAVDGDTRLAVGGVVAVRAAGRQREGADAERDEGTADPGASHRWTPYGTGASEPLGTGAVGGAHSSTDNNGPQDVAQNLKLFDS